MKRIFKNKFVQYIGFLLVTVIVIAVLSNLTSGFTKPIDKDALTPQLNEDNYFFEKIEDGDFYTSATVDAVAKNGIITFDGKIADSDPSSVDVGATIQLASISLKAGEYTFTCFNKEDPSWKTYMAVATYTVDGTKYTVHADFDKAPNNTAKDVTKLGQTFTLEQDATVVFSVQLMEGVNLDNVKAIPVLVDGDEVGAYSVGILK